MEPLISLVNKAIAAFKRKDYAQVVLLLDQAFEYVEAMDYTAMDAKIYNALYDAYEMLQLIIQLAIFEHASFHEQVLTEYKTMLDRFTSKSGGTLAELKAVMPGFLLLLRGMAVGIRYLQHRKLAIDVFPPAVSFEITPKGRIRLYAWTETDRVQVADIEDLRAEFNDLFREEQLQLEEFQAQLAALQSAGDYQQALALIDKAILQHESYKPKGYIQKGDLLFDLKQYSEAVDAYLKARVLGTPKHLIQQKGKIACQFLIQHAPNREQRMEWTKLLKNFF